MEAYPEGVRRILFDLLRRERRPAFLAVTAEGILEDWGGDLAYYGMRGCRRGMSAVDVAPVLQGALDGEAGPCVIERFVVGPDAWADVHVLVEGKRRWVVFVDVSREGGLERDLQQARNELALLLEKR